MLPDISKIIGVHPGAVLSRELKKNGMEKKQFALSIDEFPQTISAISQGRRGVNPALSIKLGNALGVNESYFMLLQAYYEVEKVKKQQLSAQIKPDLSCVSKATFWDTDIEKIDWQRQKRAVILRVFERGSEAEIKEFVSFYGKETVVETLKTASNYLPSTKFNADKILGVT
jgi:antitoxin HigA-1